MSTTENRAARLMIELAEALNRAGAWDSEALLGAQLFATGIVFGTTSTEDHADMASKIREAMRDFGRIVALGYDAADALDAVDG